MQRSTHVKIVIVAAILVAMSMQNVRAQDDWVPIIGAESPDGGAYWLKRFDVAPGSVIAGVKFVNNDSRTLFPKIALLQGPVKTLDDAVVLAELNYAEAAEEHLMEISFPAVAVSTGSEVYVALALPVSDGVQGIGDGDGIIATPLAESDSRTSFFVPSTDGSLGALDVDLRMALVLLGAGKADGRTPGAEEDQIPTAVNPTVRPNPFNPLATIEFGVPQSAKVQLGIYDVKGRLVRVIVNETMSPGLYQRPWDGRDDNGRRVASGIYVSKLRVGSELHTQKLVLTK